MPTNVNIQIKNIEKISQLASKFPAIAERHIDNAITRSLAEVQRQAQPITPVKTRRLWGDLQIPHLSPFQGWIDSNLPYAVTVHNLYASGTKYHNPSLNKSAVAGFLTIAVDKGKGVINDLFKTALNLIVVDLAK
jgi:hypothetical protein